jgi:hypothetical protein
MRIEVLYFEDCPNYLPVMDLLKMILRQNGLQAGISQIQVKDAEEAKALNFFGSPTIRINGFDIEPEAETVFESGFACRHYVGRLPSEKMIRAALRRAQSGQI